MMGNSSSSDRLDQNGERITEMVSHALPVMTGEAGCAVSLVVERVQMADIRLVYPLMMMAERGLDLSRWVSFATPLLRRRDGRAGILAARRHVKRFPCGAVCFRQTQDLRHGTVLLAEHFVVVDPIDPQSVLRALSDRLDCEERALGCGAVRVVSPDGSTSVELRQAGHGGEGIVLLKAVLPEVELP